MLAHKVSHAFQGLFDFFIRGGIGAAHVARPANPKGAARNNGDPFFIEHSWFVGFAPTEKPQLIVSVLLGNPESWHLRGHEAAKRLIDKALGTSKSAAISAKDRAWLAAAR